MDSRYIIFHAIKSILRRGALEVIYNANVVTVRFGLYTGRVSEGAIRLFWILEIAFRSKTRILLKFPPFLLFSIVSCFVNSMIFACDVFFCFNLDISL